MVSRVFALNSKRYYNELKGCFQKMIKKLYEKSELWFAIVWIVAYCVLASTADNMSADIGILKIVTLPVFIVLSVILYLFVKKNGLTEK